MSEAKYSTSSAPYASGDEAVAREFALQLRRAGQIEMQSTLTVSAG